VLYRIILVSAIAWILVIAALVAMLVILSWLGSQRLADVTGQVSMLLEMETTRDALMSDSAAQDSRTLSSIARRLDALAASKSGGSLSPESAGLLTSTSSSLKRAAELFQDSEFSAAEDALEGGRSLLRGALGAKLAATRVALGASSEHQRWQQAVGVALAILISVASLLFFLFVRLRIVGPLRYLEQNLERLSRRDFDAADTLEESTPMGPLFEKYKRMVGRMRTLDEAHTKREDRLQEDVEKATRALIHQQAALARADRMATVGDLTARLAHDLRNPLSGVLLALTNMLAEQESDENIDRLETVISELERAIRLLNNIVDEARLRPESPIRLQLSQVVTDLIKLLRYQLDPRIAIRSQVADEIYCRLPDAGFRHVLLNLVTNAAQAIGERQGQIEIDAAIVDGQVELTIADDGTGFPQELLRVGVHEHGFFRAGGSGFGLATARRFVLAHGAQLRLANRPDGGGTVVLILPVDDCNAKASAGVHTG